MAFRISFWKGLILYFYFQILIRCFSVTDMNDNPPLFDHPIFAATISDRATRGHFVTSVQAFDPDAVDQSELRYFIVGGNERQIYSMDAKTGEYFLFHKCIVFILN